VDFYSARLQFVVLVEGQRHKTNLWDESIVAFRARDYGHAFQRALEIGRSHETEYLNMQGRKVRWALVKVETLDHVGRRVDGQEVASRLDRRRSKEVIPFNRRFRPEAEEPSQSF
jgi:hypothetical protein